MPHHCKPKKKFPFGDNKVQPNLYSLRLFWWKLVFKIIGEPKQVLVQYPIPDTVFFPLSALISDTSIGIGASLATMCQTWIYLNVINMLIVHKNTFKKLPDDLLPSVATFWVLASECAALWWSGGMNRTQSLKLSSTLNQIRLHDIPTAWWDVVTENKSLPIGNLKLAIPPCHPLVH